MANIKDHDSTRSGIKLRRNLPSWFSKKLVTCRLSSLTDIQKVACLMSEGGWVFRGQYSASWPLVNSLERVYGAKAIDWRSEHNAILDFRDKTRLLMNHGFSLIDTLATMQHYGVPTRLLDFTRAFFVALFFAFEKPETSDKCTDHAVWAVNLRQALNGSSTIQEEIADKVYAVVDVVRPNDMAEEMSRLGDHFHEELMSDCHTRADKIREIANDILWGKMEAVRPGILPIDLPGSNSRMAAQNGLFIMTTDFSPFEVCLGSLGIHDMNSIQSVQLKDIEECMMSIDCLSVVKFTINEKLYNNVRKLLRAANISNQTLFPDLSGIASQIKYKM